MDLQDHSCLHSKEKKQLGNKKTTDNRKPSTWTSFPPMLRKQTLSQYLSPDSIYSAQHTTHLNTHLVSQSLLSTAMRSIFHFPLQMVSVLQSAHIQFPWLYGQTLALAQFVGACHTFVRSLFFLNSHLTVTFVIRD